jgi:transposase-like protein
MRCRNCEEPIDVLDLCEICEMKERVIEPVEIMMCKRGHFMTKGAGKTHSGWLCNVCRRMNQAAYRARLREERLWKAVHS